MGNTIIFFMKYDITYRRVFTVEADSNDEAELKAHNQLEEEFGKIAWKAFDLLTEKIEHNPLLSGSD